MLFPEPKSYQVLARKYRPVNFDELIGQEVLVRTLSNSIASGKVAHAFILTGIRGIGKTTTARIIAKALNCVGENGEGNDSKNPCGACSNCVAISNSRFQDVIEVDAASRTGVDDIREIIDSINYAPAIGKYKIYIIDEVHMLSNNAFNALLKTLEEPPAHTKFIFATTEIRKVPATVLSRCQRFDLRRLSNEELVVHLTNILKKENFEVEEQALNLIASAAEGSVRDSLSILDSALSHNNYQKFLPASVVIEIMGFGDKNKILELFELILKGDVNSCLKAFEKFYENSTDIIALLQDLIDVSHKVTLIKTIKDYKVNNFSLEQNKKANDISLAVSLADLIKIWQMLLKGLTELNYSINQKMAFEMLLIRMCHLLDFIASDKHYNPVLKEQKATSDLESTKSAKNELVQEIIRNFPDSKVV